MYNVLIVDDEQLMRTNLISIIDWNDHGFNLSAVVSSSEKALTLISRVVPDIILSDVKMPNMDGLELCKRCKELCPKAVFIAMSSFDDFEYVKGILQNGALDYLLKHNLSSSTLLEVLQKAKNVLSENKNSISLSPSNNNILALKERFLINLLSGFYRSIEEIKSEIAVLDMQIGCKNAVCIIMDVDDYHLLSSGGIKDITLFNVAIINIIEEILSDFENGAVCHFERETYIIILTFETNYYNDTNSSSQSALLRRIQVCLNKFLNLSVSFSIGTLCQNISDISSSFFIAQKNMEQKLYKGKNCIITGLDYNESLKTNMIGLEIEKERRILTLLHEETNEPLLMLLNEIFYNLKKNTPSADSCKLIFNDLLSIINRICREEIIHTDSIFENSQMLHIMLYQKETLEEIHEWFIQAFSKLHLSITNDSATSHYSEIVKNSIVYIRKNYENDLSLSQVAEQINVSSVYLSKLFKKETKIGFNEYLCNLRLEKAKLLISEKKYSFKEISSMCGFNNYTYFFNVFKQKTGLTPKEFAQKNTFDI